MSWLDTIQSIGLVACIEILVLTVIFYYLFLFFRGTRGAHVLVGLTLLIIILIGVTQVFHLDALNWVLRSLSVYLAVALLVIFQPEIRRALAELGKQHVFASTAGKHSLVDQVLHAVKFLADRKVGALIGIEGEIGTRAIQETGIRMDTKVIPELLASMFFPHTPLHDGGVIIRNNRIVAAGCLFPLSQRTELSKTLGTRHRAGIGLTEETDAVVIIVSEESGTISVAYRGRLIRDLDGSRLRRFLSAVISKESKPESAWERAKEQLDLTPEGIAKSEKRAEEEKRDAE